MEEPQTLIEFLDDLIEKAQLNVYDYEEFHTNKLADIRKMDPMDSFLYGVATGKLDVARNMRALISEVTGE
jgi:hypothetical protein